MAINTSFALGALTPAGSGDPIGVQISDPTAGFSQELQGALQGKSLPDESAQDPLPEKAQDSDTTDLTLQILPQAALISAPGAANFAFVALLPAAATLCAELIQTSATSPAAPAVEGLTVIGLQIAQARDFRAGASAPLTSEVTDPVGTPMLNQGAACGPTALALPALKAGGSGQSSFEANRQADAANDARAVSAELAGSVAVAVPLELAQVTQPVARAAASQEAGVTEKSAKEIDPVAGLSPTPGFVALPSVSLTSVLPEPPVAGSDAKRVANVAVAVTASAGRAGPLERPAAPSDLELPIVAAPTTRAAYSLASDAELASPAAFGVATPIARTGSVTREDGTVVAEQGSPIRLQPNQLATAAMPVADQTEVAVAPSVSPSEDWPDAVYGIGLDSKADSREPATRSYLSAQVAALNAARAEPSAQEAAANLVKNGFAFAGPSKSESHATLPSSRGIEEVVAVAVSPASSDSLSVLNEGRSAAANPVAVMAPKPSIHKSGNLSAKTDLLQAAPSAIGTSQQLRGLEESQSDTPKPAPEALGLPAHAVEQSRPASAVADITQAQALADALPGASIKYVSNRMEQPIVHATATAAQMVTTTLLEPHQARLDSGIVQVEIVRMVRQGGGQVVMELTPPDQSKFRIELKIDALGTATLVVDGASDSTRTRLEQGSANLREQFTQMGLNLQLDMRQHREPSFAQHQSDSSGAGLPDDTQNWRATSLKELPVSTRRLDPNQGQVHLYA